MSYYDKQLTNFWDETEKEEIEANILEEARKSIVRTGQLRAMAMNQLVTHDEKGKKKCVEVFDIANTTEEEYYLDILPYSDRRC